MGLIPDVGSACIRSYFCGGETMFLSSGEIYCTDRSWTDIFPRCHPGQSWLVHAAGSFSLKCTAASNSKRCTATCLQHELKPTMHVKFPVRTQPSVLLRHTQVLYSTVLISWHWLSSTYRIRKIN